MSLPQDGAWPRIFTIEALVLLITGLFISAGSGAGTSVGLSAWKGANTCGKPLRSRIREKELNHCEAPCGSTRVMPLRMPEERPWSLTVGTEDVNSASPRNQATISTATTDTTAPLT